jgi:hypothetical protein
MPSTFAFVLAGITNNFHVLPPIPFQILHDALNVEHFAIVLDPKVLFIQLVFVANAKNKLSHGCLLLCLVILATAFKLNKLSPHILVISKSVNLFAKGILRCGALLKRYDAVKVAYFSYFALHCHAKKALLGVALKGFQQP